MDPGHLDSLSRSYRMRKIFRPRHGLRLESRPRFARPRLDSLEDRLPPGDLAGGAASLLPHAAPAGPESAAPALLGARPTDDAAATPAAWGGAPLSLPVSPGAPDAAAAWSPDWLGGGWSGAAPAARPARSLAAPQADRGQERLAAAFILSAPDAGAAAGHTVRPESPAPAAPAGGWAWHGASQAILEAMTAGAAAGAPARVRPANTSPSPDARAALGRQPLRFEANVGQT